MQQTYNARNRDILVNINGRPIGSTAPGPMTRRLRTLFRELTKTEGVSVCE
ncbi:MAG: hypothetical protein AABZ47_12040 [Planctomycetota bacterium]